MRSQWEGLIDPSKSLIMMIMRMNEEGKLEAAEQTAKKRKVKKMKWDNLTERQYKEHKREISKMQSRNVDKKMNVLADHVVFFRTTKSAARTTPKPLLALNEFNDKRVLAKNQNKVELRLEEIRKEVIKLLLSEEIIDSFHTAAERYVPLPLARE